MLTDLQWPRDWKESTISVKLQIWSLRRWKKKKENQKIAGQVGGREAGMGE